MNSFAHFLTRIAEFCSEQDRNRLPEVCNNLGGRWFSSTDVCLAVGKLGQEGPNKVAEVNRQLMLIPSALISGLRPLAHSGPELLPISPILARQFLL